MFRLKTIAAVLCSLLMGLLALFLFTSIKSRPAPAKPPADSPAPVVKAEKPPEKKELPQAFSERIPKGMRITTIKVNEVSGVTREIKKGDRVDVVAVTRLGGSAGGMISRIVLQNIPVFDLEETLHEKHITDKAKKIKKEWAVRLLVSPDQGIMLSSVTTGTDLQLLLRNKNDDTIVETSPTVYTSSTGMVSVDNTSLDPSSRLKPGMRAVTLKIDNSDGICGALSPGDRVDVIFSCKSSRFTTQGGNITEGTKGEIVDVRKSARILIQDVEVLTTQSVLKTLLETNTPEKYVTLSVTPSQAEQLALITESTKTGTIKLIARNRQDETLVRTRGEMLEDVFVQEKRGYRVIHVLKGGKDFPVKFYVN